MKRTFLIATVTFILGLAVGSTMSRGVAAPAQIRSVKRTELLKTTLTGCESKELYVAVQEAGPGVAAWHYHPGDSVTYILEGSQVRENADGKTVYHAGELIADLARRVHRTENEAPVKMLIVRVLDKGQPEMIAAEAAANPKR